MFTIKTQRFHLRGRSSRHSTRLHLEWLESRALPAALTGGSGLAPILSQPEVPNVVLEVQNSQATPQDLGVFSPGDLDKGITVLGSFQSEKADYYAFQVTYTARITITVQTLSDSLGLPSGSWLGLIAANTNQVQALPPLGLSEPGSQVNSAGQITVATDLAPGTYVMTVTSWAAGGGYGILFTSSDGQNEAPTTLNLAALSSFHVRFNNSAGPTLNGPPSPITTPASAIVPVAFTASSDTAPVVTIPASVYVALGAGSVGGSTGTGNVNLSVTTDVYDRIYGQGPALALSERFIGLAILSQVSMSSYVETPAPASPSIAHSPVSTTGVIKTDTSLDWEEEDFFDGEQVRGDSDGIPAVSAWDQHRCGEYVTESRMVAEHRIGASNTSPRFDAAIAVSVLFAALGERRRRYAEFDTVTG